jgi:hypothetical protein
LRARSNFFLWNTFTIYTPYISLWLLPVDLAVLRAS